MRKQSSILPIPRGSRVESFSIAHSISASFSKYNSKHMGNTCGKQETQGLWQEILKDCLKTTHFGDIEDLHGTLFVLGRANGGKSELINELKKIAEKGRDSKNNVDTNNTKNPYIGLDFCNLKISSQILIDDEDEFIEDEDEINKENARKDARTGTIDIWSVDHCEMSDEVVKRLVDIFNKKFSSNTDNGNYNSVDLNEDESKSTSNSFVDGATSWESPNIMFLIVLDSSLPWTLNDDLMTWIQQIQDIWTKSLEQSNAPSQLHNIMIQELNYYFESENISSISDHKDQNNSTDDDNKDNFEKVESYPKVNLGIPISVVLTKSDIGQRFTVPLEGINGLPFIPFSLSFIMNIGDSYGISYFVTSILTSGDIHQTTGVDLLFKYIIHRLFGILFVDEEGKVIKNTNNVIFKNNSILCVLPKTPRENLLLKPLPDVKNLIYEELVPKSKFSTDNSVDTSEFLHGLSTAFDKNIPSLNEFLETIKPQIPQLEYNNSNSSIIQLTPNTPSNEENKYTVESISGKGSPNAPSSQRLKPTKPTLSSSNSNISGDPSLKGFFQSLIQRGEKKANLSHRSSLRPASSMNLRKDSNGKIDQEENIERKTFTRKSIEIKDKNISNEEETVENNEDDEKISVSNPENIANIKDTNDQTQISSKNATQENLDNIKDKE